MEMKILQGTEINDNFCYQNIPSYIQNEPTFISL